MHTNSISRVHTVLTYGPHSDRNTLQSPGTYPVTSTHPRNYGAGRRTNHTRSSRTAWAHSYHIIQTESRPHVYTASSTSPGNGDGGNWTNVPPYPYEVSSLYTRAANRLHGQYGPIHLGSSNYFTPTDGEHPAALGSALARTPTSTHCIPG